MSPERRVFLAGLIAHGMAAVAGVLLGGAWGLNESLSESLHGIFEIKAMAFLTGVASLGAMAGLFSGIWASIVDPRRGWTYQAWIGISAVMLFVTCGWIWGSFAAASAAC